MRRRSLAWLFGAALFCGLSLGWLWFDCQRFLRAPLPRVEHAVRFEVAPGTGLIAVARALERMGHLDHPRYLVWYARWKGRADTIVAGEYLLSPGMTPRGLLDKLTAGDVVHYTVTIPEGWTFRQLMDAVRAHPRIRHTLGGLDDAAVMKALGHAGEFPEGRFFPDTYQFVAGTTDVTLLRQAYQMMREQLDAIWAERAPGLPLTTPYQALILASIIERETAVPEERPRIAGVFIRRLQRNMRLQADPTVIYGVGLLFEGRLRRRDLVNDTPYNTYTRAGLPPTPIALPGGGALRAAVNPAPGDEIYFVARGDGSHYFSASLDEHQAAVRKYQLGLK
jgi:UPF0755 protein